MRLNIAETEEDIFPEDLPELETTDDPKTGTSALVLSTKWSFDTLGISTVTRSLINDLRMTDPAGQAIEITCAVLDEEDKIEGNQLRDAAKYHVQLKGAKQPRGKKRKPELSWLNEQAALYYRHIVQDKIYDFIIGHIPYLTDGSLNLRDLSKDFHKGHSPKVILVAHALPLTDEGDVDEECVAEWLEEADLVFSVGDNMWMTVDAHLRSQNINPEKHNLYLPGFPSEFLHVQQQEKRGPVRGQQNILVFAWQEESNELDLELAVISCTLASQNFLFSEGSNLSKQIRFNFEIIASSEEERTYWESNFNEIIKRHNLKGRIPAFKFYAPENIEKLLPHLRRATLLILPVKPDCSTFGTEALIAVAAGIPILVSSSSGIASYLQNKGFSEPIVWDNEGLTKNLNIWKERLIQKITNPEEAQTMAKELRRMLLLDTQIACTHLNFIREVFGKYNKSFYIAILVCQAYQACILFSISTGFKIRHGIYSLLNSRKSP